MTIRDASGRDVTDAHYRVGGISQTAKDSYRRAVETANAQPSGNPVRNLRAEGNQTNVVITDPSAIREAMKHDL